MTETERSFVAAHFKEGFRDLYVRDIEAADAGDVRMGTFVLCAAFIDALGLTFTAGDRSVKGGLAGRWAAFVRRYFAGEYEPLALAYDGFRCKLLHNYSARGFVFLHGNAYRPLHLSMTNGGPLLVREPFVRDVIAAFDAFEQDALTDEVIGGRALAHFKALPPMMVHPLETP